MKPRKLKIKGLNSFLEMQIVDFETLISRGVFGIFGSTGSGKSTILDAITLALYGYIPRGSTEYINTSTNEVYVSYDFEILNHGNRKNYIAERKIKRDKNGKYKTSTAKLIEKNNEDLIVLAEGVRDVQKNIEQIIGLNGEDFTRSVVLPQGKFSEFLKLSGKGRRDMLERIFALQEYGESLYKRIRIRRKNTLNKLENLEGQLKHYEGISEEKYDEINKKLLLLIKDEDMLKKQEKKLEKDYEKYKVLWELNEELDIYVGKKKKLLNIKQDILMKKNQVEKAERALEVKSFIYNLMETEEKIGENKNVLKKTISALKNIKKERENLEELYMDILNKKDIELPELIKKESNILQAIDKEKKIRDIESDRKILEQQYIEEKGNSDKLERKVKSLIDNIKNTNEILDSKEEKLKDIKIQPEYREKVQKAHIIEHNYKEVLQRKNEINKQIKEKQLEVNENTLIYNNMFLKAIEKEKLLNEFKKRKETLMEGFPGDEGILIDLKDQLVNIEEDLKTKQSDYNKLNDIKKEINKLKTDKDLLKQNINNIKLEIEVQEKNIELLSEEIDNGEKSNLISFLIEDIKKHKPCPLCGSVEHPNIAKQVSNSSLDKKRNEKKHLQEDIDKLKGYERELDIKLANILSIYENLKEEKHNIRSISFHDIEKLVKDKKVKEEEFNKKKKEIIHWIEEKKELDKNLEKAQREKNKADIEEIKLKGIITSEEKTLNEKQREQNKICNEFNKIKEKYFNVKKELKLQSIKEELKKINNKEKEYIELENEINKFRQQINTLKERKEKANNDLNAINNKISIIVQSGKEKKNIIDDYKIEIENLCSEEDLRNHMLFIKNNIEKIKQDEIELKNKLDLKKKEFEKTNKDNIELQQTQEILYKHKEKEEKMLQESLEKNGFSSKKEVQVSIINIKYMEVMRKNINDFEDNMKNINNNINRIEEKLNGEKVTQEFWNDLKMKRENISSILYEKIREIASIESNLKEMKKDLKNAKQLLNIRKDVVHKKGLLDELVRLVQGNKFVEFVASGQLEYIAIEASKRLKSITSGRYCILLDPSGNFVIRDDNSGGMIRPISTLSGGETFLASLSLAIALSSQIQLKGTAPLEFFFLDEGFGTLDNELLDVVITSLEKLRNERLSIGIISHVEELKNRVPIKLMVKPSVRGIEGSKVEIEYT